MILFSSFYFFLLFTNILTVLLHYCSNIVPYLPSLIMSDDEFIIPEDIPIHPLLIEHPEIVDEFWNDLEIHTIKMKSVVIIQRFYRKYIQNRQRHTRYSNDQMEYHRIRDPNMENSIHEMIQSMRL